jgi:transcriptional regulator with PAS, ATPase and Fis domain
VIKKHKEMEKSITNVIPDWAKEMNCAVTVCDADCNIIYMNSKSRATFAKRGDLIGKNLLDCHNERSQQIIRHLLDTGGYNCYTIQKGGLRKMIYQTAWRDEQGAVAGLVEISMVIPEDMPHYIRD